MSEPINKLATNGTAATVQSKIRLTTRMAEVEVTPKIIPNENYIETLATAITMVNSETMINEIAISTFTSETIAVGILTSTPMSLEETLVEQTNIPEDEKDVESIGRHSTARTLQLYKPDPYGRIRVRTADRLFRQAKENRWYK